MRKTREEKAITLIALIITIVVLLILAVVAINAVTGDGIIQHAVNAKEDYEKAQAKENGILAYYEQYLNTQSGSGPWKQDGDNVLMTDSEGNKIVLKIGDKVEYDEGYDPENLKTTTLDSNFVMKDLEWRVLGINGNGQLELISTQPTDSVFALGGEDGYLNGPAKLNKICSDLYSTEVAIGRSLNADDIDELAGIKTEADKQALNNKYGNVWYYKYDDTLDKIVYSNDYNSETKEGTWEETDYESFKEPGKREINSSNTKDIAKVKQTSYNYIVSQQINLNLKTADEILISDLISKGLNNENSEADSSFKKQWLASTCCECNPNNDDEYVVFAIRYLDTVRGRVAGLGIWLSKGEATEYNDLTIRPVVTLKAGVELKDNNNNGILDVN